MTDNELVLAILHRTRADHISKNVPAQLRPLAIEADERMMQEVFGGDQQCRSCIEWLGSVIRDSLRDVLIERMFKEEK